MSAAVCSSRRVKRETSSLLPPVGGAIPFAPSINTITANGSGGATITWVYAETLADGASAPGTLTPAIYHSSSNGAGKTGTKVTGITPGATSHTFTPGTGSPRYFIVTAENAVGESEQSAQRAATIT